MHSLHRLAIGRSTQGKYERLRAGIMIRLRYFIIDEKICHVVYSSGQNTLINWQEEIYGYVIFDIWKNVERPSPLV